MNPTSRFDPRLIAHHVGARGYGVSFYVPPPFAHEVVHVLYEADPDAVEQLRRDDTSTSSKMLIEKHVLPYALGRQRGTANLNVTANPYASSLLPPNPEFGRYHCEIRIELATYDVPYAEMLEVVKQVPLEVHALDQLFAESKIPVGETADFISIDTQGYELEILEGARQSLGNGTLAMVSEVEFLPMYVGQPLFEDILRFMRSQGFFYAGLTTQYDITVNRTPVGLRGKNFPAFGDALFLRDLGTLTEERFGADRLHAMLLKLAFIATTFGYVEYALAAADAAERVRPRVSAAVLESLAKTKYATFVAAMRETARAQGGLFPPLHAVQDEARLPGDNRTSWYDKHHKTALERFAKGVRTQASTPVEDKPVAPVPGRSTLRAIAHAILPYAAVRWIRRMLHGISVAQGYTRFEKLLDDNGFNATVHVVRQRRLAAEPFVQSLDEAMARDAELAHLPRS